MVYLSKRFLIPELVNLEALVASSMATVENLHGCLHACLHLFSLVHVGGDLQNCPVSKASSRLIVTGISISLVFATPTREEERYRVPFPIRTHPHVLQPLGPQEPLAAQVVHGDGVVLVPVVVGHVHSPVTSPLRRFHPVMIMSFNSTQPNQFWRYETRPSNQDESATSHPVSNTSTKGRKYGREGKQKRERGWGGAGGKDMRCAILMKGWGRLNFRGRSDKPSRASGASSNGCVFLGI